ncbi:putative A/G-specific adenine glycosylase, partial [Paenibacillus sp. 598K]
GWAWTAAAADSEAAAGLAQGAEAESTAQPRPEQAAQMELLTRQLAGESGVLIRPRGWWMAADHIFSHIVWDVQVYLADYGFVLTEQEQHSDGLVAETRGVYEATGEDKLPDGYRWIGPEEMEELAFPNVFLRILRAYWTQRGLGQ